MMGETDAQLFARLRAENPDFARLAEKHRHLDQQISAFERLYYLTSEQERKRKELQKQQLVIKDQLCSIMRQQARVVTFPRI